MNMLLLRKRVILVPKTIEIVWISAAHNSFVLLLNLVIIKNTSKMSDINFNRSPIVVVGCGCKKYFGHAK